MNLNFSQLDDIQLGRFTCTKQSYNEAFKDKNVVKTTKTGYFNGTAILSTPRKFLGFQKVLTTHHSLQLSIYGNICIE